MTRSWAIKVFAVLALAWCGLVATTPPAAAAKVMFGTRDHLVRLADIDLKGPNGEQLYLGHKYSQHAFIAPYRLEDSGYVLGVVGERQYFTLTPELLARLQAEGKLPKVLPPYEIGLVEYLVGHMLWIMLAAIAGLVAWGAWRNRQRAAVQPLVDAATEHLAAGQPEAAIDLLSSAIEAAPAASELRFVRAIAYRDAGEPDKAIADFSTIIRQDPKHAFALFNRALIFMAQEKLEPALADLNRVARIDKGQPHVMHVRGLAHAGLGHAEKAVADFTAALTMQPTQVASLLARAEQYVQLGRYLEAAADRAQADDLQAGAFDQGAAA